MLVVGPKGRAASLLLGSLRLAKLLMKLHLWQFFSKQVDGWIAAFGHIQTCRVRERAFPNIAEHTVLDLMLSQHAAAKDKRNFEIVHPY